MSKNYKKFDFSEINADEKLLEETPIHGELDIETLVFRQIERTNQSALQDEALFAVNVRNLLNMLPSHKRSEVTERSDEYTSVVQRYDYKYNCGVPMGTPEKPVNNSPTLIEETVIDWYLLLQIILDTFEECGLTYKFDKWTVEVGGVEKEEAALPSPAMADRFKQVDKDAKQQELNDKGLKHGRACAICRKQVEPETGCYFKVSGWEHAKIVHKKGCYDLAKQRWGEPQ